MVEHELKICSKCGKELPLTDFYKDNRATDGRQSDCKSCHCKVSTAWHKKNPEKTKGYARAFNKRHPELWDKLAQERKLCLDEYKSDNGCIICGETEPCCLDFHHLNPNKKDANVGSLLSNNIETLINEIRKCILVCKNCHAKIHKYGVDTEDDKLCIRKHIDNEY